MMPVKTAIFAIRKGGEFDEAGYLREYQDVAKADLNVLEHYLCFGIKEGRILRWNDGANDYEAIIAMSEYSA